MMITEVNHVHLLITASLVDSTITVIVQQMSIVEELMNVVKMLPVVSYQNIATYQ